MNKWIGKGRLARDLEVRYTQSGKAVASFTLACNRQVKKGSDGKQTADFISCVAWEGIAQTVSNYLMKGREVLVEGRLQTRSYEAKDGSKRYVTEIVADEVEFLDSRKESGVATSPAGGFGQTTGAVSGGKQDQTFGPNIPDEEIPF